jgi:sugar phosphate isomerase/epimerase
MSNRIKFATDLVTFYAPSFWGQEGDLDAIGALFASGKWDPAGFWQRILTSARDAGLDGIEITFAPGDFRSARQAFGSAHDFASAVHSYELEVCSGFLSTTLPGENGGELRRLDFTAPADHPRLVELAIEYAEFLQGCGAAIMVVSLPIRRTYNQEPPLFVDLKLAEPIATVLNQMGYETRKRGVRIALHPEAFTLFRNSRDVDLFMLLTDPTYIDLCPDTAQFTVAGSDPLEIVRRHRDRLVITHWKDAAGPAPFDVEIDETIFARQVQWFAGVGTGVVDWPAWMRLLRELAYTGWAVFELDTAPDPVGELQRTKAYVESALAHIYR